MIIWAFSSFFATFVLIKKSGDDDMPQQMLVNYLPSIILLGQTSNKNVIDHIDMSGIRDDNLHTGCFQQTYVS